MDETQQGRQFASEYNDGTNSAKVKGNKNQWEATYGSNAGEVSFNNEGNLTGVYKDGKSKITADVNIREKSGSVEYDDGTTQVGAEKNPNGGFNAYIKNNILKAEVGKSHNGSKHLEVSAKFGENGEAFISKQDSITKFGISWKGTF